MRLRLPAGTLALLVTSVMSAAAGQMAMPMEHGHHRTATPAEKANAEAMQAMMRAMDAKPSGDPDKNFARMMMAHHIGAIAMAKVELQYGHDPEMRALAADIIAAQDKEIAQMKAWIAAHP